jgi:hypothetical protein
VLGINLIFKSGIKYFEAVTKFVNVLTHLNDYLGGGLGIIRYVDRGNEKRLVSLVVFRRQVFYEWVDVEISYISILNLVINLLEKNLFETEFFFYRV